LQSAFKWRWTYVPVILVLGLIWYEFWSSSRNIDSPPPAETQPHIEIAAQTAAAPATLAAALQPATLPEPPAAVMDPFTRLLKDPPPISISLQNATFRQAVDALNNALSPEIPITLSGNQENRPISLELKDKPFWEVFEAIQAQSPFDVQEGSRGFVIRRNGQGIRQFERIGGMMLCITQIAYSRNISGQNRPGDAVQPPRMQVSFCAVVDPRIHIVRRGPITVLRVIDDGGQEMPVSNSTSGMTNQESNCWTQALTWSAPEKLGKKMTIQCTYSFTAQNGETEIALDDIENKKDQAFEFGSRRLRIARCELNNRRLSIQVAPADEQPEPQKMSMTITDGTGAAAATIQGLNGQVTVAGGGPYKLTLKGPNLQEVNTKTFAFEDVIIP
jgi:hypothetical protein